MNASAQSASWMGRMIGDRYRLEKRIGAGGMGDVFLATDTRLLNRQVALKLLKGTLLGTEQFRERFEREVMVCAHLQSPHIVQVFDYGVTEAGEPYYVMEYLQGETLGQRLKRERRLSVEEALQIITQSCDGLQTAHQGVTIHRDGVEIKQKIVHRDLKPENFFLVPVASGVLVKIVDFGIAKVRHDEMSEQTHLTATNVFMGTPRYAAPEQIMGEKSLDERADLYSLGVMLYEMLSGVDPFGFGQQELQPSSMSWAMAHTSKPVKPLRSQAGCEQISPALESVVMRCLEKEPEARFASVSELMQALKSAVTSPSEPIKPSIPVSTVAPPASSRSGITEVAPRPDVRKGTPPTLGVVLPPTQVQPVPQNVTPAADAGARRQFLWIGGAVGGVVAVAALAVGTLLFRQQGDTSVLSSIRTLSQDQQYEKCITQAQGVPTTGSAHPEAQKLMHTCQLGQAQTLAEKKQWAAAIAHAIAIPPESELYPEVRPKIEQWSNQLLTEAAAQLQAGKLDAAIAQARTIPEGSPMHDKATATIAQWQKDWLKADARYQAADAAIQTGNWQRAMTEIQQIPPIRFWQDKAQPLLKTAQAEIARAAAPRPPAPKTPPANSAVTRSPLPGAASTPDRPSAPVSKPPVTVEPSPPSAVPPPTRGWEDDTPSVQPKQNDGSGGI